MFTLLKVMVAIIQEARGSVSSFIDGEGSNNLAKPTSHSPC